jgi:hypothetical protein
LGVGGDRYPASLSCFRLTRRRTLSISPEPIVTHLPNCGAIHSGVPLAQILVGSVLSFSLRLQRLECTGEFIFHQAALLSLSPLLLVPVLDDQGDSEVLVDAVEI